MNVRKILDSTCTKAAHTHARSMYIFNITFTKLIIKVFYLLIYEENVLSIQRITSLVLEEENNFLK